MVRRAKQGQAAIEFLMTYGWAILVVLVVIGALAYFGVLNPSNFLPKRCVLGAELTCSDFTVNSGGFHVIIQNNLQDVIQIQSVTVSDLPADGMASGRSVLGKCTVAGLAATNIQTGAKSAQIDTAACAGGTGAQKGGSVKALIAVAYKNVPSGLVHNQIGEVVTTYES